MNQFEEIHPELLSRFHPEPGTSLAHAIADQMLSVKSNETIRQISSTLSRTESNIDSEKQSLNELENPKYKTELCRNFSAHGFCSYSTRCQFAHGLEELRCRMRHPKYKTEFCRNFFAGYCKYGSRCQFLHNSNENKSSLEENNKLIVDYPTTATIGTYLLTNILAQSALEGTIDQQSILMALAACTHFHSNSNSSLDSSNELFSHRTRIPLNCGIEMRQVSHFNLSSNSLKAISIPQNQNNNNNKQHEEFCKYALS